MKGDVRTFAASIKAYLFRDIHVRRRFQLIKTIAAGDFIACGMDRYCLEY